MNRLRKVSRKGKKNVENFSFDEGDLVDWTALPTNFVTQVFLSLNYRDRANLSSTCRAWSALSKSPLLWASLDLRPYECVASSTAFLASRCQNLQKLCFRGLESVDVITNLEATNLRKINIDCCKKITDATLSVIAARHEALECLVIGPDLLDNLTSDSIKAVAFCCHNLRKLCLSNIFSVKADAINALAKYCKNLIEIEFNECLVVDETAIGNIQSLRYLSVAGSAIKWDKVVLHWNKLPNLIALDVSGTSIEPSTVSEIFSSFSSLKLLCAMHCTSLENDAAFVSYENHNGKVLLAIFTDILKGSASLFVDIPNHNGNVNPFLNWRNNKIKDEKCNEMLDWLEWVISSSLLRASEENPPDLYNFWRNQGMNLFLTFLRSAQEEVQERAVKTLTNFVIDDRTGTFYDERAEAVLENGGIALLFKLARSWREEIQFLAATAISNLLDNANVVKVVAEEGGIDILVDLARSWNRLVSEEAAGGLHALSIYQEHQKAIVESGGAKALVDLILKWSGSNDDNLMLLRVAEALMNLATNSKCTRKIVSVGGVRAFLMIAEGFQNEVLQRQAAQALSSLASYGRHRNTNNAVVGQEVGALEALVQLALSPRVCREEAARALYNLSLDNRNRERIAAAGGMNFMAFE